MKIMFIAMKYNMGYPARGLSYEYFNMLGSLENMKEHTTIFFPYDEIMLNNGKNQMNKMLIDIICEEVPDLCIFDLQNHQIEINTLKAISDSQKIITLAWFGDDAWRFEIYSKYYAPLFDWVVTLVPEAVEKYKRIGCKNVIATQMGCNPNLFPKPQFNDEYEHDISFVGKKFGNREALVKSINHKVDAYGLGWENGMLDQSAMNKLYNTSKINLNFSQSNKIINARYLAGIFLNQDIDGSVSINNPEEWIPRISFMLRKPDSQIKARVFEIMGCGGFLLSEETDGIEKYYENKKEIVIFKNWELSDTVQYYLDNEKERKQIAMAGYKRTITEHTYENRFNNIFKEMKI